MVRIYETYLSIRASRTFLGLDTESTSTFSALLFPFPLYRFILKWKMSLCSRIITNILRFVASCKPSARRIGSDGAF